MAAKWYAQNPAALYEQPRAEPWQIERARTLLDENGGVPLEDLDAHRGALTLLRDHLRGRLTRRPTRWMLRRRLRAACERPGFAITMPQPSRYRAGHWLWIDPATIARGALGVPFTPYHESPDELVFLAETILLEQGNAHGLNELFGYPGKPVPAVVADSIPGPFGPVRPIGVNGNHRTLALEAIEVPVLLCQVHRFKAPYRCKFHEDDDWPRTLSFLRWLEARQVLRLSARPIVREDPWVWLRVADATVPWLAAPPRDALGALRAYQEFYRRPLLRIGSLDTASLEREWRSVLVDQG